MAMSLSPKRFFKFSLLALAWLTAAQAFALQITSPVLSSRQGEPLKLSFLITDISSAESQELKVGLAEAKVYQSTQLTRVAGLDDINFTVTQEANGNLKVMMTGMQTIGSAHADLIIDLSWSTGRRFINLGVDFDTAPPPLANKADTPAPSAQEPAAVQEPAAPEVSKTEPPSEAPAPAAMEEKPSAPPAEPAPAAPPSASNATSAEPSSRAQTEVKAGDTASKLLLAQSVQGVSLDQLLLAMLNMNPNAFVKDNVNRLVAGAMVTLPNADEAGTYDPKHARENIRLQATDFKAYRASLAGNVPNAKQANASKRQSSGSLKAEVAPTAKAPDDQLTLSKPGDAEAEKLSKQLQDEDTAKQTKDVEDNLRQMGQLSQAMEKFKQGFKANFPMLSATYDLSLDWASHHVFELIGGLAVLIALLIIGSVLRSRREKAKSQTDAESADPQEFGLSPEMHLPPAFNLDLDLPEETPSSPASPSSSIPPGTGAISTPPPRQQVVSSGEDPFLMRLELADELWNLGQKQTAMALAQEVADQTHGETRELAQRWLKEHS